jgi:hypothetical protein
VYSINEGNTKKNGQKRLCALGLSTKCKDRRPYLQHFLLSRMVFTLSQALIDFELVRVAFTVTSTRDFKATFYRLVFYRLPHRRALNLHDHALVDALCCGWLSTIIESNIEVIHKPSDTTKRITPSPIPVVLFYFSRWRDCDVFGNEFETLSRHWLLKYSESKTGLRLLLPLIRQLGKTIITYHKI